MNWKRGDVVMLASGGPEMVVEDVTVTVKDEPLIMCAWFDSNRTYQNKGFPPEALVPVEQFVPKRDPNRQAIRG